eukprot:4967762-Pyramimonas_sp.AAC.1
MPRRDRHDVEAAGGADRGGGPEWQEAHGDLLDGREGGRLQGQPGRGVGTDGRMVVILTVRRTDEEEDAASRPMRRC